MLKIKGYKGITLIALVISIVVLLILAGVTLSQITGSESVMEKATEAREKNKQGAELEAIKLAVVNSAASGLDGLVDTTALKSGLNGLIQENSEDVITGDGPWVVTSPSGRVYEINNNSTVNELTGLVLTPNTLTLKIEDDTYEEKTINARLIDIDGTLTWSDSTDKIDITPSEDGKSATIKAKKSGTEIITVSCSNGDTIECIVKIISLIKPQIGDCIQYNVSYTDMYNTSTNYTSINGWKILYLPESPNSEGKYEGVKIISTGIPVKLRFQSNQVNENTWWDTSKTGSGYKAAAGLGNEELFKNITFDGDGTNSNSGWNKGNYTAITVATADQGTGFNSNTGAIFITNKALGVHNLTLAELNTAMNGINGKENGDDGYRDMDLTGGLNYNRLFILPNSYYWLATAGNTDNVRTIYYNNNFSFDKNLSFGLRPVVTLKTVTLTWNSTNSYWEVE